MSGVGKVGSVSNALLVVGVFGLVISTPTAILLWVKLGRQPGSALKRYLLVRFALVKPLMWLGILLAGIGGHSALSLVGFVLVAVCLIVYFFLMVIGRMIMRRLTEHEQGKTASDQ